MVDAADLNDLMARKRILMTVLAPWCFTVRGFKVEWRLVDKTLEEVLKQIYQVLHLLNTAVTNCFWLLDFSLILVLEHSSLDEPMQHSWYAGVQEPVEETNVPVCYPVGVVLAAELIPAFLITVGLKELHSKRKVLDSALDSILAGEVRHVVAEKRELHGRVNCLSFLVLGCKADRVATSYLFEGFLVHGARI